ncbi:hypothetical protein [Streptomyces niveiscabiei]|uniref:Uncharacterized protein n=1 Tax=Streptomyces niveiscabiei TaxID=164115 RepID=A0ABW9HLI3_9ACTN
MTPGTGQRTAERQGGATAAHRALPDDRGRPLSRADPVDRPAAAGTEAATRRTRTAPRTRAIPGAARETEAERPHRVPLPGRSAGLPHRGHPRGHRPAAPAGD